MANASTVVHRLQTLCSTSKLPTPPPAAAAAATQRVDPNPQPTPPPPPLNRVHAAAPGEQPCAEPTHQPHPSTDPAAATARVSLATAWDSRYSSREFHSLVSSWFGMGTGSVYSPRWRDP